MDIRDKCFCPYYLSPNKIISRKFELFWHVKMEIYIFPKHQNQLLQNCKSIYYTTIIILKMAHDKIQRLICVILHFNVKFLKIG